MTLFNDAVSIFGESRDQTTRCVGKYAEEERDRLTAAVVYLRARAIFVLVGMSRVKRLVKLIKLVM